MAGFWLSAIISVLLLNTLTVDAQTATKVTITPSNIVMEEGAAAATLECVVTGLDTATQVVSFQKGSTVISDDDTGRTNVPDNLGLTSADFLISISNADETKTYSLFVRKLQRSFSGEYKCLVCGKTGTGTCDEGNIIVESSIATLAVAYPPNPATAECSIQSDSGNTQVFVGEAATLSCVSGSAVPDVVLVWRRNGQDVEENVTHEEGKSRASVVVTGQNTLDDAVFECMLTYTSPVPANSVSAECRLEPLKIVSNPIIDITASAPVIVGGQVVFTCSVSSTTSTISPDATEWTSRIDANRYAVSMTSNESVLTITTVQDGDHGAIMTCSTTDQNGITSSATKMLLIDGRPEPTPPRTEATPPRTEATTLTTSSSTEAPFPLGATLAGVLGGLLLLILLCALLVWFCHRRRYNMTKKKQTSMNSHVQIPMNNANSFQAMPDKVPKHKRDSYSDGKDYPDDRAPSDPDVIPREKRGGHDEGVDPRKWWRETVAPTDEVQKERSADGNDYPTIRGMKMPFQDRASPYMHVHDDRDHGDPRYSPVDDRSYRRYNDQDFSDSGYREPRYNDGGYDDPQSNDQPYDSVGYQDQPSSANNQDEYDNQAYQQSINNHLDHGNAEDPYNNQYDDRYDNRYDDQYNDEYRPDEHYDDRPQDHYNDQYDDRVDNHYDDQYADEYADRYGSYGRPDGQEEIEVPSAPNEDYYPGYEQDERIPDGHSSINDHHSAPYDDRNDPDYNNQPADPNDYNQDYSSKHSYQDEDLRNSQETPSYV